MAIINKILQRNGRARYEVTMSREDMCVLGGEGRRGSSGLTFSGNGAESSGRLRLLLPQGWFKTRRDSNLAV